MIGENNTVTAKRVGHKKLIVIILLCLVLATTIAGAIVYRNKQDAKREQLAYAKMMEQDQKAYDIAAGKVDIYRGARKYDQAIQEAQQYLAVSKNPKNAANMLNVIASLYEVQKDNKKALDYYRQAERMAGEDVLSITTGIARTSLRLGDEKTALEYYNKRLAILNQHADNAAYAMEIDVTQKLIKKIEAAQ